MTLAPSRLLPLSGNRCILYLLIIILLVSCGASKKPSETIVSETASNKPTDNKPKTLQEVLQKEAAKPDSIPKNLTDSSFNKKLFTYKDRYEIAILLPFYLHSIDGDTAKSPFIDPESKLGIEFYKGVIMAIDSLQAQGLKARFHVFDSQNNEDTVKSLLTAGKLENMDLVIGPIFNTQARLVADYCKKKNITMVSPLSPTDNITSKNANFIMANPRLDVHCEQLLEFAFDSMPNSNYVVVYQDNPIESKYAAMFDKLVGTYNMGHPSKQLKITKAIIKGKGLSADLSPYMSSSKPNIIIIPSVDLPFLVNIGRELYTLVNKYDLTVMGMPIWGTDENLRLDYSNAFKLHFTSPYYVRPEFFEKDNALRSAFIDRFGNEPSENALKAYDLVNYFGKLIIHYGINYRDMMLVDYSSAWSTAYKFRKNMVMDATGKEAVEYIENKHVNILKYEDFQLELVNHR